MSQPISKATLQEARRRILSYLDKEHPALLTEIPGFSLRHLQCAALSLVKDGLIARERACVYYEGRHGYAYTLACTDPRHDTPCPAGCPACREECGS